jgi:glutamate-1-semialdehyde 2,1-aminomutase
MPDVAVFSKALGNGYPIAAVIGRAAVMEAAQRSFISSTNWTDRIGPAAALAMIGKFRHNNVHDHLIEVGAAIQQGWQTVAARHGIAIYIGGIPPLSQFSFEMPDPLAAKAYFVQLMLDQGILASTSFYSMYSHTPGHVAHYLDAADRAFAKIASAASAGSLGTELRGAPAASGFKRLA